MMTYGLPNHGMDDWFTICAIAFDKEGNRVELGRRAIHCLNNQNISPFGTIDTPEPGGTVSGSAYVNFGWTLTPQPDYIPTDGSTIWVWVDGLLLGHPAYNNYREDISTQYPNYANSNGAVGYRYIDTTVYSNDLHTIAWSVFDSGGQGSGIGSRYFWVTNGSGFGPNQPVRSNAMVISEKILPLSYLKGFSSDWTDILVKTGYKVDSSKTRVSPDGKGEVIVTMGELDRVEIDLAPDENPDSIKKFEGYVKFSNILRELPVGSTFDETKGIFYWMPGPAFLGEFELVFVKEGKDNVKDQKGIKIKVGRAPKKQTYVALDSAHSPISLGDDSFHKGPFVTENHAFQGVSGIPSQIKPAALVESLVPTYYLYSFDGKLLAEYDQSGACVKDYIYLGSSVLAEYRPAAGAYYYYTSDQINSVRMITDGAGQVVYSAAYSSYGKIHTEWVNTYQPSRKFSGKEREWGSGLDDFGARYYGNQSYRFISPDPVIGRSEAVANPQLWNLYAYCRNNPGVAWGPDRIY